MGLQQYNGWLVSQLHWLRISVEYWAKRGTVPLSRGMRPMVTVNTHKFTIWIRGQI